MRLVGQVSRYAAPQLFDIKTATASIQRINGAWYAFWSHVKMRQAHQWHVVYSLKRNRAQHATAAIKVK